MKTSLDELPTPTPLPPAGHVRHQVLGAFASLAVITYLDRICMAQAAGPIRGELGLSEREMGLVFSAFTLAYTLFEIPSGWLGDRIGPRKVLVRVVLWWSLFTALTGWAWGLTSLILIRFAFGAGEAGAFPNVARALTHWFPPAQRGRVQGAIWTTARLGGAVAPPLSAAIIALIGWRSTFVAYGLIGVAWAFFFARWYRDEPADHPSVTPGERAWIASWSRHTTGGEGGHGGGGAPWSQILKNPSVWGLAGSTCFSSFAWFFNATWLPTYLEESRGLPVRQAAWFASLPFVFGVLGCSLGGWLGDALSALPGGRRWARRCLGFGGMMLAAVCFLLSLRVRDPVPAVILMTLSAFFNDLPISALWASIMDIGERDAGRVAGLVNTASGFGAFFSPILFGVLLEGGYGWLPSLVLAGAGFVLAGLFWLLVDPTRTLSAGKAAWGEAEVDLV